MIAIFVLLAISVFPAAAHVSKCSDDQVRRLVAHIEDVHDVEELALLRERPRQAAACLIRQLRVVDAAVLRPHETPRRRDDLRVVWSIRALRYLTGGKNFCSPTVHFDDLDKDRRHFLTITCGPGPEVSFFGVWMSRDIIFVAPKDAQVGIIRQWIDWYESEGKHDSYPVPKDTDWYF